MQKRRKNAYKLKNNLNKYKHKSPIKRTSVKKIDALSQGSFVTIYLFAPKRLC